MTKASTQPPTLYDETYRSIRYPELSISSMANRPNLIGHLEHHAPTTDGSFSICVAGGKGVFISQVWEFQILSKFTLLYFSHLARFSIVGAL